MAFKLANKSNCHIIFNLNLVLNWIFPFVVCEKNATEKRELKVAIMGNLFKEIIYATRIIPDNKTTAKRTKEIIKGV